PDRLLEFLILPNKAILLKFCPKSKLPITYRCSEKNKRNGCYPFLGIVSVNFEDLCSLPQFLLRKILAVNNPVKVQSIAKRRFVLRYTITEKFLAVKTGAKKLFFTKATAARRAVHKRIQLVAQVAQILSMLSFQWKREYLLYLSTTQ
ncbi:MAG: hypothetical protein DRR19_31455, partial [Candidatus Parabeggiatoa sp. nov. 1]